VKRSERQTAETSWIEIALALQIESEGTISTKPVKVCDIEHNSALIDTTNRPLILKPCLRPTTMLDSVQKAPGLLASALSATVSISMFIRTTL